MSKHTDETPGAYILDPSPPDLLPQAGKAANAAAAGHIFIDATARKAPNTVKRYRRDLDLFADFLEETTGAQRRDLLTSPHAWRGVVWGLVSAFRAWLLSRGYAIATINGALSTVRTFAGLAAPAGAISSEDLRLIQTVKGYARNEARNIDQVRKAGKLGTRKGFKKAAAVRLSDEQAAALLMQPDTPQGARDRLLICLLLLHGLRIGEAAILTRDNFDLGTNAITFERPKVNKTQSHIMSAATRKAARAYLKQAPARGLIWLKSTKRGGLSGPLSETSAARSLRKRVKVLGLALGIDNLSPHDLRHYCATYEADQGTAINRIVDMLGWNTYSMAKRYIDAAAFANQGTARIRGKGRR